MVVPATIEYQYPIRLRMSRIGVVRVSRELQMTNKGWARPGDLKKVLEPTKASDRGEWAEVHSILIPAQARLAPLAFRHRQ
jgi:hypothetical protein